MAVPRFVSHVQGDEGSMKFNSHIACVKAWKWKNAQKMYRTLDNLPVGWELRRAQAIYGGALLLGLLQPALLKLAESRGSCMSAK